MKKASWIVVIAGAVVGLAAVVLTHLGNPANMGFCIACFLRDTAGGLGLHRAAAVQYIRPRSSVWCWAALSWPCAARSSPPRAAAHLSPALCWASS